jgi:hypothetical protein
MLSTVSRSWLNYELGHCLHESDYQNKIDSHKQKIEDARSETAFQLHALLRF